MGIAVSGIMQSATTNLTGAQSPFLSNEIGVQ
jgi:hypothetical protein